MTSLILPSTCNCVNQGLEEWELGPEYLLVFSNGGKGHGVGGGGGKSKNFAAKCLVKAFGGVSVVSTFHSVLPLTP